MKALTSAQKRKILYNYYREQGYTPTEARRLRGRWRTVWSDYTARVKEVKNFGGKIPKPPKIPLSKREKNNIKSSLIKHGISKKVASQWVNIKPHKLYNRHQNLKKYWKTVENELKKTHSDKVVRRMIKKMRNDLSRYRSSVELFAILGEIYDEIIGITI